jgi:hypothetical protein
MSRPLRRSVVDALAARARDALGPEATPLFYVEAWVRAGLSMRALARTLSADLGYPVSRSFVSFAAQRLAPDARERIAAARQEGRDVTCDTGLTATLVMQPTAVVSRTGEDHQPRATHTENDRAT